MEKHLKLNALFLSDIHLGCPGCMAEQVIELLSHVSVPRIYLNGDLIDCWALSRGEKWTHEHSDVIRQLLKMHVEGTEFIYLRGNHDDFLDHALPLTIGGIPIQTSSVHETEIGKKYLVIHGDGFDAFSTNLKWIGKIGAFAYDGLMRLNTVCNRYRKRRGKGSFSFSKWIKAKMKAMISAAENFHQKVEDLTAEKGCEGIIVGHIHTPADEMYGDTHYLNCGDWVETGSCVVEYPDGEMGVLLHTDFCEMLEEGKNAHLVEAPTCDEAVDRELANDEAIASFIDLVSEGEADRLVMSLKELNE